MSWSAFFNEIDGQLDDFVPPAVVQEADHVKEQFDQAVKVAHQLIESRVLGFGHKFNVSLSGHANPGHAPTAGWANDSVVVGVSQATVQAPVEVPEPVVEAVSEEPVEVVAPAEDPAPAVEPAPEPVEVIPAEQVDAPPEVA